MSNLPKLSFNSSGWMLFNDDQLYVAIDPKKRTMISLTSYYSRRDYLAHLQTTYPFYLLLLDSDPKKWKHTVPPYDISDLVYLFLSNQLSWEDIY